MIDKVIALIIICLVFSIFKNGHLLILLSILIFLIDINFFDSKLDKKLKKKHKEYVDSKLDFRRYMTYEEFKKEYLEKGEVK